MIAPLRPRPDAGFSVVMVTATILIMLILGLSLVAIVSENSGLALHHVQSNQAFYAAQAGIEYAIVKLNGNPSWGGLPLPGKPVGPASFWIALPDSLDELGAPLPAGQKRIVSTGICGEATRVVQVRITTGGIRTVAGAGAAGYGGDGGPATAATMKNPQGVALGPDGSFYVVDTDNHVVRKVDAATGIITTVAGRGSPGSTGDGTLATDARLQFPEDVFVAPNGDLYIADTGNHSIRKVTAATGIISTIAGVGSPGFTGNGGPGTVAKLRSPSGVSLAANGDVYLADSGNHQIRRVAAATGIITAYAGTGAQGYSGDGGLATAAKLRQPQGVEVASNGDVYIADTSNHVVRRVAGTTGLITTVAGTGTSGDSGDGGPAVAATLHAPESVTVGPTGEIVVADTGNHVIRSFAVGGTIATIAGTGVAGYSGDGGQPTAAQLNTPTGVAVSSTGFVYVADDRNQRVRKIGGGMSIAGWAETRV